TDRREQPQCRFRSRGPSLFHGQFVADPSERRARVTRSEQQIPGPYALTHDRRLRALEGTQFEGDRISAHDQILSSWPTSAETVTGLTIQCTSASSDPTLTVRCIWELRYSMVSPADSRWDEPSI